MPSMPEPGEVTHSLTDLATVEVVVRPMAHDSFWVVSVRPDLAPRQ